MLAALAAARAPNRLDGDSKRWSDGGLFSPFSFLQMCFPSSSCLHTPGVGRGLGAIRFRFRGGFQHYLLLIGILYFTS